MTQDIMLAHAVYGISMMKELGGSVQNGFNFAGGTGTAWELGFARAQGKDVIVLCTDIKAKQSLMIINSGRVVMPYEQYKEAWKIYNGLIYLNDCYIHPDLQDQS